MAKTLILRPYIFSPASSRTICCFFLQSRRPFVSQTEVLISKAGKQRSSMFYCNNKKNLKLQIQNDGGVVLNSAFSMVGHRRFTTRATNVNDAGSIDSPLMESMEKKIKEQLNAESVIVKDASGDGRHVCIDVISSAFEGQSAMNRQRMVYKAIWEELQNTVHAIDQMTTRTPDEAGSQK